jgi:hypothetical protein
MKPLHLDPDWLRRKYVDEGLSTYDIGAIVNRDPKRVYEKLRDFGIPTRPRGENLKGADCYMKQPGTVNPFAGRAHSEETRRTLSEKASVPKPYLRGHRNGMAGKFGPLNPRYIDGSSPERQRLYARSDWKEFVKQVYERDGYACRRCGAGHTGNRTLCAHHVKPWAGNPGLRYELGNVVTLCNTCHNWVHSRRNVAREWLG